MWSNRGQVAISGVGFSEVGRSAKRPLGLLARTAIEAAVADCGLTLADIDGIATYPDPPFAGAPRIDGGSMVSAAYVISNILPGPINWFTEVASGFIPGAFEEATNALLAGACQYAVVWRAVHRPAGTYGRVESKGVGGDAQFAGPFGVASPIQWHALTLRRYTERYGDPSMALGTQAVIQRDNAQANEFAYFNDKPITMDDYLASRVVVDPLRLLDCDIPVQACTAVVLTTADRARDLNTRPAYVAGFGQNPIRRPDLVHYTQHDYYESGRALADILWRHSGIGPSEVSVAELYDGFSPSLLYWLEAAGFCPAGEGAAFILDGHTRRDGDLPVNTHGGSLSQGRLHGMGHIAEAALQVSGRADGRQVADCAVACMFEGSPMQRGSGLVLTREP